MGTGAAQIAVPDTGMLVYQAGSSTGLNVSIFWLDAEGKFLPLRETPGSYARPRISPDGKRLALEVHESGKSDIWVYDFQRQTPTRLTFDRPAESSAWTPDGRRITYFVPGTGFFWTRADGAGEPQQLTQTQNRCVSPSSRPDGRVLAFQQQSPGPTNADIMVLTMKGDERSGWKPGELRPFLNTRSLEALPAFSFDGRWLAYVSNESGEPEIYVRPFPGPGGKWQVSSGGGLFPKWSRNGKELLYQGLGSGKIMVANYTARNDSFGADKPRPWSLAQLNVNLTANPDFDLHPDGRRLVVLKPPGSDQATLMDTLNFMSSLFEELRRMLPNR